MEPFLFYVLTQLNTEGYEVVVAYFSKEKKSFDNNNLACILTLPPYQRKGYGRFLIDFSIHDIFTIGYELSKLENKIGSPERPLSDLGLVGYKSYWTSTLLGILRSAPNGSPMTVNGLVSLTAIKQDDVVNTLKDLNLVRYLRGQHIISVSPKGIDEFLGDHPEIRLEKLVLPEHFVKGWAVWVNQEE